MSLVGLLYVIYGSKGVCSLYDTISCLLSSCVFRSKCKPSTIRVGKYTDPDVCSDGILFPLTNEDTCLTKTSQTGIISLFILEFQTCYGVLFLYKSNKSILRNNLPRLNKLCCFQELQHKLWWSVNLEFVQKFHL